ncbi:YIP1 family protein [Natronomonas sp. EA1]|uniref:YIP1 family protein n=1 Tax=Natronomonas sp. EA1 TaxID=3421655 RepID=UPI003EC0867B
MLQLLYDPDGFFASRAADPSLLGPTVVVAAATAANLVSMAVVMAKVTGSLDGTPLLRLIASISYSVSLLISTVGVFITWVAVTAVVRFLLARRGRTQPFRDLFKLLGWGYVPAVCSATVAAVATVLVYTQVTFPDDPARLSAFFAARRNDPAFLVSRLSFLLFSVWQGFLWFSAVENLYDVSARTAAAVVAVPTLGWILIPLIGGLV